jgi:hypothetical protein
MLCKCATPPSVHVIGLQHKPGAPTREGCLLGKAFAAMVLSQKGARGAGWRMNGSALEDLLAFAEPPSC